MRLLIMLSIVISATTAFAGMSGKWSGQVDYSDSQGNALTENQSIYFFPYAENHVYFADTFWGYQLDLEVRNGELFLDETKLGTVSENQFKIYYAADDCTWKLSSTLGDDGQITFIDGYACTDGYFDHTEGTLSQNSRSINFSSTGKKSLRSLNNGFRRH
jgi:hypothetical protein